MPASGSGFEALWWSMMIQPSLPPEKVDSVARDEIGQSSASAMMLGWSFMVFGSALSNRFLGVQQGLGVFMPPEGIEGKSNPQRRGPALGVDG